MIANSIEREILIDALPEAVWRVVTEPDQISLWFADETEIDLRPGGDGVFRFRREGEAPVVHGLRVTTVEPPRMFGFRWGHPEGDEPTPANSMLVELTLISEGGGTRLRLVESGLDEVDWPQERKAEYLRDHSEGWDRHLGRLARAEIPGAAAR
jgi:uncharacterized protein YndB with AHSA1/START domain